jgi:transposase
LGRALSRKRIAAAITRAGRRRRSAERAAEIQAVLRREQLPAPAALSEAMGASVAAMVAVTRELNTQVAHLEEQLAVGFDQHPDAKVVRSLPGLGTVLGARVLGEFGDDPDRYADAKARKNYAGTSPITKASGKSKVVLARYARNKRLSDACYLWAFAAITASPGARSFYDARRTAGDTHSRALRALANRLVGILHGCLRHGSIYNEDMAWGHRQREVA